MKSKQAEHAIRFSSCRKIRTLQQVRATYLNIPLISHAQNTVNLECYGTNKHIQMEAKAEKVTHPFSFSHTHTNTTQGHTPNNIIKRDGGMPWEPTGVCLWGRRGQVWGHTSSVSAERRVDHTNSIMATNTAIMRPQISTTKMPPMFSMPRP